MPIFEYSALNAKGKSVSDIIDAESVSAARQKLRAAQIYPVSIREVHDSQSPQTGFLEKLLPAFGSRVRPGELAIMTRQLATLLQAGFPLVSAIYTLIPQTRSRVLKRMLSQIKDAIEEGSGFAEALSEYPETFSPIYINMVRSGESSGTLELVLNRLADITERQQALSNRVRSAMAYPVLMLIVGVLILMFLLTYIVPSITAIFTDMDQSLPAPTRALIAVSEFLKASWWMLLGAVVIFLAGLRHFARTQQGAYRIDKAVLQIPLAGNLKTKLAVARFSRTLGSLLENGVPLMAALDIVKNIVGNRVIAEAVQAAAAEVEKGAGLGKSLESSRFFPHLAVQMIQVGENSGELEAMLAKMADIYENEVESTVSGLTSMLEPAIILVMALVVGFIVLSIILPIFEMNQMIG